MIADKRRAFWIGGSDTYYVMGNWYTKSFKTWWLEKLGLHTNSLNTKAMKVGNAYEHKVLDFAVPRAVKDAQVVIPELSLRVNYDGLDGSTIYEVKTYSGEKFSVSKRYWEQAQAEMYALLKSGKEKAELYILAYHVGEDEYANYFKEIEDSKLSWHKVMYDESFAEKYEEKLIYLKGCMQRGVIPS